MNLAFRLCYLRRLCRLRHVVDFFTSRQQVWSAALALMFSLIAFVAPVNAAEIGKQVETVVGPGTNPEVTITDQAEAGDKIFISFKAKKGWHFTKQTEFDDTMKLGWKRTGPHSFSVSVRDDLAIKTFHSAQFNGEMEEDVIPGGNNNAPSKKKPMPWDIMGKFKLLYEHEGVGSDFNRTKPGVLKSKKPETAAIDSGVAKYDPATKRFVGTFAAGKLRGTGQHTGEVIADRGTATSIDLQGKGDDHEKIDCPEGDKVKVIKVYLGVDDTGTIGGLPFPDPDKIELNTFSVATELAKAEVDLLAATAALQKADAAVVTAKADLAKAEAEKMSRQADVDAAIAAAVVSAQKVVDAKQKAVTQALKIEGKLKEAFDKIVSDGAPIGSARYKNAKRDYDQAVTARIAAEAALADAKERLTKAKATAEQNPAVIAARAALVLAEAAVLAKQTDLTTKQTAAKAAEKIEDAAAELVALYKDQEVRWVDARIKTLIHENGHRRILYTHIDKMTAMLNTLRVWGYALKEGRAKSIAEIEFKRVRALHVQTIIAKNRDMQGEGTGYDGITQHGITQEKWTTWPNGTYP